MKASDITNLELKLDGKLPIDRDELLTLVNSWGRNDWFYTKDKNNKEIIIEKCRTKEKYNLSKLDVSKIKDFNRIFNFSNYNGDINSWDVLNATSMECMFYKANKFNQPLDKWDTSKVTDMSYMFANTENFNQNLNSWNFSNIKDIIFIFEGSKAFNQPILWDLSKVLNAAGMFCDAKAFENRFNKGYRLPYFAYEIKDWLKQNKELMEALDTKESKGNELDDFLLNLDNKDIIIN